jgi:hypothetical protein
MNPILSVFSFILFVVLIFVPERQALPETTGKTTAVVPVKDSIVTARISFTGDLMCHVPQYETLKMPMAAMISIRVSHL